MRAHALLPLALLACEAEPESAGETVALDPGLEDAPSDYSYAPSDGEAELLDMETLATGIEDAVRTSVGFSGDPVLAAYDTVMATADEGCPAHYAYDGNEFWYDACTSDAGTTFDGYGFYYAYEDADLGDGNVWNGATFTGLARVEDSEGHTFEAGGTVGTLYTVSGGWNVIYTTIYGGFAWDGAEAEDTWLETTADPDLVLYGVWSDEAEGWTLQIDGAASGVSETLSAITFDAVILGNPAGGVKCTVEPIGDLRVRDNLGTWYDIDFDATQNRQGAACDGCGAVTVEGESIGEVCVDIRSLEEALPW